MQNVESSREGLLSSKGSALIVRELEAVASMNFGPLCRRTRSSHTVLISSLKIIINSGYRLVKISLCFLIQANFTIFVKY